MALPHALFCIIRSLRNLSTTIPTRTRRINQILSENRAKSVMDYLITKGIDKKRLKATGYGDTKPVIADAQTEEDHQKNRRTEYRLYK